MGLKLEAKRVKIGNSLTTYETTAVNAINQLQQIKIQLPALKTQLQADSDFTVDDEDEVQATIDFLLFELSVL